MIDFAKVSPADLRELLTANGWSFKRHRGEDIEIWNKGDLFVSLPTDTRLADYRELVRELLKKLSVSEHVFEGLLAREALTPKTEFDVIEFRNESLTTVAGMMPVLDASGWLTSLYQAFLASASHLASPKPFYVGRRPEIAVEYAKQLQLIPPKAGSFIMTVLSPLQSQAVSGFATFSRRSTIRLLDSMRAAVSLAETATYSDIESLTSYVASGVTSNLCDAICAFPLKLAERGRITITADLRGSDLPQQGESRLIIVEAKHLPVLRVVSERIRYSRPLTDIELTGSITKCARRSLQGSGIVFMEVDFDGRERQLKVSLSEETYEKAVVAHSRGLIVAVRGDLIITKGRLSMPLVSSLQTERRPNNDLF